MPVQECVLLGLLLFVAFMGFFDHQPAAFALIPDPLDVGGFPVICASLLLAALLLRAARIALIPGERRPPPHLKPVIPKTIVLLVLYMFGFSHLGFYSATILFTLACLYVFLQDEPASPKVIVAYTAVTTLCWYVMFTGFQLYLPKGLLF
ncbi:MAG: tripartite tricarboxylate transporter TctB family protein [Desulfovibrio sp.]|jgi:hypothetical protein|nr:tripartite tricarboxylate transporter TctB family protein [Desulfovibrio sp.]